MVLQIEMLAHIDNFLHLQSIEDVDGGLQNVNILYDIIHTVLKHFELSASAGAPLLFSISEKNNVCSDKYSHPRGQHIIIIANI